MMARLCNVALQALTVEASLILLKMAKSNGTKSDAAGVAGTSGPATIGGGGGGGGGSGSSGSRRRRKIKVQVMRMMNSVQ